MYPTAKQPRRSTTGCLAARSGASIRRVRGRRAKQAGAWEKEREQASMPEPEKTLSDQWIQCGYCNKWRLLPDGSFAWPKNEWFGCDDAGVTCLTKATKRPRGNEPYPWSQPGQCWSVRRNGHNPWSH